MMTDKKKPAVKKTPDGKKKPTGTKRSKAKKLRLSKEPVFSGSSKSAAAADTYDGPADAVTETKPRSDEDILDSMSPLDRKLADPVLPELPRENRARLQLQSPTRLYFYWSIKHNPFKTLSKAFGGSTGSYSLVVKLVNRTRGTEEIYRVDPEGNWWFAADPDSEYRAEVGFYAPNRPYIRIIYSNSVSTPRRSPSRRTDYVPRFTVTADEFADVLEVSGYSRDAFEVALAGDDRDAADEITRATFDGLLGSMRFDLSHFDGDELRFVLLALASGFSLDEIKTQVSAGLYKKLFGSGVRVSPEQALAALQENFEVDTEEIFETEEVGPAVVGLSAINFPKRVRSRRVPTKLLNRISKLEPVSSAR
ncbi:MAG: DUF4912 domain-containing protein [Acidobacteria bacterium]|nr:MAG: DUF4912 domain-containing protein [Acidobacteriota bacterium]REK02873.1 MAG: DUF4912 domain-containing protein [Acidobacteriota bacterium]REK13323.1 MAG: DUF4912 domain-containing protein [Acidobacteriota bacterium]REK41317.1 MAG: DUF4912 domain-containing protein [Acidobacteriota bacterium]